MRGKMKLFDLESPLMQALGKMADLLWLNILTIICCIPVVTVGASLTAMNYMALKMVRDEECYITKDFFKSFKQNFKQGTLIWLLLVLVILFLSYDYYIVGNLNSDFRFVLQIVLTTVAVALFFTVLYVFPLLAKFDNTV